MEGVKGEGDKGDNIWHQVLRESSKKTRLLEEKTVVVLGERSCGKSSILARLQGLDISEAAVDGVALDYTYLDVFGSDESDDLLSRAHIWTLEGDVGHAPLLDFTLNDKNIAKSLAMVVLDFSQPWTLVESLEKWLKVLENHIEVLKTKLSSGEFEGLQKRNIIKFQQYKEPVPGVKHAAGVISTHAPSETEEEVILPSGEDVLTKNLGIPIVVVCNKADAVDMLEKEYSYKDDVFVYIQQYLRRICLNYGAALIYVSAKRDTNCDVLHKYLMHNLYSLEFATPAQLVEKELIFVPMGWDSKAKIDIDFANQKYCTDSELPFDEVVKRPQHSLLLQPQKTIYEVDVSVEDDQDFLSKMLKNAEKADAQKSPATTAFVAETEAMSEEVPHTPVPSEKKAPLTTPSRVRTSQLPAQLVAQAASALTPLGKSGGSTATLPDRSPRTPMKPGGGSGIAAPATPGQQQNEHKVLADFFNSLINKDPRKTVPTKRPSSNSLSSSGNNIPAATSPSSPNGSAGVPSPSRQDAEKSMNRLKGEQS